MEEPLETLPGMRHHGNVSSAKRGDVGRRQRGRLSPSAWRTELSFPTAPHSFLLSLLKRLQRATIQTLFPGVSQALALHTVLKCCP